MMMTTSSMAALVLAVCWDRFWGEPATWMHPVVWMGKLIRALSQRVRRGSPRSEFFQGTLLVLVVLFISGSVSAWLFQVPDPGLLRLLVLTWALKSCFSCHALGQAATEVRVLLEQGDLAAARLSLRNLCSRDAADLSAAEVAAATVESVAENASDSIVAPLFYFALFGLPGAVVYRAVNTMDAMIGYHGNYEFIGKCAARLDDLLNLIPARLTAWLLLLAGFFQFKDWRQARAIWRRDAHLTESPNAGHPMAVMAGLLRVRLAKRNHYALGDDTTPVTPGTIARAWSLVLTTAFLMYAVTVAMLAVQGGHNG